MTKIFGVLIFHLLFSTDSNSLLTEHIKKTRNIFQIKQRVFLLFWRNAISIRVFVLTSIRSSQPCLLFFFEISFYFLSIFLKKTQKVKLATNNNKNKQQEHKKTSNFVLLIIFNGGFFVCFVWLLSREVCQKIFFVQLFKTKLKCQNKKWPNTIRVTL